MIQICLNEKYSYTDVNRIFAVVTVTGGIAGPYMDKDRLYGEWPAASCL